MVLNLLANNCLSMPNAKKQYNSDRNKSFFIPPVAVDSRKSMSNEILSFYKNYYNQLANLFSLKSYDEVIKLANESMTGSAFLDTLFAFIEYVDIDFSLKRQVIEITNTFIYDVLKFATNGFTEIISDEMYVGLPWFFFEESSYDRWGDEIPLLKFLRSNKPILMGRLLQHSTEQKEYLRKSLSGKTQKDVILSLENMLNRYGLIELLPYFEADEYFRKYMSQIAQRNKK
jgi:hypothetical protein